MAILTIPNLDETIKRNLRLRAAMHGCSMEEEARRILCRVLTRRDMKKGLGSRIHQRFAAAGGLDLSLPARSASRPAPDLLNEA